MNVEEYKAIVDNALEHEWRNQSPAQQDALKQLQWRLFEAWARAEVTEEIGKETAKFPMMTIKNLRDEFACEALRLMDRSMGVGNIGEAVYEIADAMMKARQDNSE